MTAFPPDQAKTMILENLDQELTVAKPWQAFSRHLVEKIITEVERELLPPPGTARH